MRASDQHANVFLYATTVTYPSQLANRRQILHQMTAFARVANMEAILGVSRADDTLRGRGFDVFVTGTTFLPHIAWKQLRTIKARGVTHVYCREIRLATLLLLAARSRVFGRFAIAFEVHVLRYPQKLDSWLLRWLSRSFTRVVVINSWMKDEMVRNKWVRPENVLVAHDAADPAVFQLAISRADARQRLGIPDDGFIAVYTGRFRTAGMDKGLKSVLRVLPRIAGVDTPMHVYAVGGSPQEMDEYARYADEQGARAFCDFVPYIPQADVALYHVAADVLLMPFPATDHFAHFMSPLKLFEYLMAGRPIVATDLPSIRDVVDERAALLIPPDSDQALHDALGTLARDPALRERLGHAAQELSRAYTWDARARTILTFISV